MSIHNHACHEQRQGIKDHHLETYHAYCEYPIYVIYCYRAHTRKPNACLQRKQKQEIKYQLTSSTFCAVLLISCQQPTRYYLILGTSIASSGLSLATDCLFRWVRLGCFHVGFSGGFLKDNFSKFSKESATSNSSVAWSKPSTKLAVCSKSSANSCK